jgi:hypothetical protein
MNISINTGLQRIWSNTPDVSVEEIAIKKMITRCFAPAPTWRAWLLYFKKTGVGVSLIVGPLKLKKHALKREKSLRVGIAEVDVKFQSLLAAHGPSALRWDGREVIANGN